MKKKPLILVLSLVIIVLIGVTSYNYVMHGGERDLSNEETSFTVTSKNISDEFITDTDASNKKYLEKAVAISGTVTAVSANEVTVDHSIICSLKKADGTIKKDQAVTVKGRVVGYDDLMGELKLDQCFVIKN